MEASLQSDVQALVRKVESISLFPLEEDEREAISSMPMQIDVIGPRQNIVREHDQPTRCLSLLSGLVCSYKLTREGSRQITAFYVPGDMPDLQSLHLKALDTGLAAVTTCRLGFIQHDAIRLLLRQHPRLIDVFWRMTLIDAAVCRAWMLNIGQREAKARLSHLLCELVTRLGVVGIAVDRTCELPITQADLADALGLTKVHVNRKLQELRNEGLVALQSGKLVVKDWEGLVAAGDFDPTYLHSKQPIGL